MVDVDELVDLLEDGLLDLGVEVEGVADPLQLGALDVEPAVLVD